jgi:hypothetical protein
LWKRAADIPGYKTVIELKTKQLKLVLQQKSEQN